MHVREQFNIRCSLDSRDVIPNAFDLNLWLKDDEEPNRLPSVGSQRGEQFQTFS